MRCLLAIALWATAATASAQAVRADHLTAELRASVLSIEPGGTFDLALRFDHDEHWHSYWHNPGDTGLATKLKLTLPEGFSAGELEFPAPERINVGDLVNFGYEGRIQLLTSVRAPANLQPGEQIEIKAAASWLVCREECIPGRAQWTLSLVSAAAAEPSASASEIAAARALLPLQERVAASFANVGSGFQLTLATAPSIPQVFPLTQQLVHNRAPSSRVDGAQSHFNFARSEEFDALPAQAEFLIVPGAGRRPYFVAAQTSSAPIAASTPAAQSGSASVNLLSALALALLGGMILNLMPCVFPVLSLKALSFASLSGLERRTAVIDGLAYTLGVVSSFVALAALLLVLRAAGQAVGWGFQLQNPLINGVLAYLFFAMGLSLLGAVQFGSSIMGFGQSLTEGHGARAAFFTGVLACVVASPCTAPFMGTALGYAVTQPAPLALLVFAVLGFGLALPMLILSLIPKLSSLLPKPGAWMEVFKQILAFPLFLTAIWLLWVVGRQSSLDAVALLLIGLVALAFALWLKDLQPTQTAGRAARLIGLTLGFVSAGACLYALTSAPTERERVSANSDSMPYSAASLASLRAARTPVLINMTADWCLTCKVNERVALKSEVFRAALERNGVQYMKGDWTHYDAEITEFLAQYKRNGVPLYVFFPATGEPRVLPQVLTPQLVADVLSGHP